jgi:archaellum component FlaC
MKSNIVEVTVKDYDVQSPVYIEGKTIVSNVGAYSYVVEYNPIVVLEVQDISPGYLSLRLNEPSKLSISVKSLNGPVEIRRIEFQQPGFLMVHVYTPLPLNVGVNETKIIEIIVKGASPGVGILRVSVVYYDGVEEKNIAMYVPVIVEEDKIYSLMQEYEAKISELEKRMSQLEARLGAGLSTTTDISNRLTQLLMRIDSLIDHYQSVVVDVNWLKRGQVDLSRDIATIRQIMDGISNNIGSLRESLLNIGSIVNNIENNYNYLANETDYLKIKTSMNEQKIGAIEQGIAKLYYGIIALGGLLVALYAVVIIYLMKTSR